MLPVAQEGEADSFRLAKEAAKSNERAGLTIQQVHQLDCIYYGEINKSYQKEGFGVLQTLAFQTYFGFWKNNKAEGKALVVFPGGEVLYGEFTRNCLSGMGVADDGKILRVGVFEGVELIGVGFQYIFETKKWKMIRYAKGVPVQAIKEETLPITEGIPDMLTAQHSLCQLLESYLARQFFTAELKPKKGKGEIEDKYRRLNECLINAKEEVVVIGLRDQGGLHGPAVIMNTREKSIFEAGYYIGNQLDGYCLECRHGIRFIGAFLKGQKQGTFLKRTLAKTDTVEFRSNMEIGLSPATEDLIMKRQKSYNFEQKDFLSAKNTFDFAFLYTIFAPADTRSRNNSSSRPSYNYENLGEELKVQQFQRTSANKNKRQLLAKEKISHTYLDPIEKQGERTCVEMIRQKMRGYDLARNQHNARLSSEEKRRHLLQSNLHMFEQTEESIAIEENPFDGVALGVSLLRSSPQRRH